MVSVCVWCVFVCVLPGKSEAIIVISLPLCAGHQLQMPSMRPTTTTTMMIEKQQGDGIRAGVGGGASTGTEAETGRQSSSLLPPALSSVWWPSFYGH